MKNIKEFINSTKLKITYQDNLLNVLNYDEIILLTSEKIIIDKDKKNIIIKGDNLSLLKILDNEVLISGVIKEIEL